MKELIKQFIEAIIKEWVKARTIFAMMFYGTLCYMVLKQLVIPDILKEIVSFLMGFYFGQRQSNKKEEVK